ncbi:IS701 family transposase [Streptomyces sp. NBC_01445]|uniref:IS701 family transposase n=1 Tax=Streptomyces sp. NBC_01445 TaxID=2903869 RepID=UPI002DD810AA|nr:IS701 family transposase [Streptomyces sp. NBC_01445]WSE11600.1 IS701 family transposase [Streptomyces sp. NBC_01445]
MSQIAGWFARVEPRLRAKRLVLGLLSDLPRKNCWTIAEWAGEATPHCMQHLLCRAAWDAEAIRDDVREYVVEHLHDEAAVLVVDETGDVKNGTRAVGVQRRYTGTAGRIENSQIAVYLVYAGERGHAAVDRELCIPRSWTCDPDRCRAAGLSEDTVFATKPELARVMIERFLDTGHRVGWVTGDEVYGGNPKLRSALEKRGIGYVLAVACSAQMTTGAGTFRADALVKKVPKRAWQKLSAGRGAKGQRFYDWAVIDLAEAAPGHHQLLVSRNHTTGELAYYRRHFTTSASLATLVKVAGSRWRVEETFPSEKGLAGLDEHQVRRYLSWARWVTLAMLAHAFLAVVRADEHAHRPTPANLIPLTCNEIQRLFISVVVRPAHGPAHRLSWSAWRRSHQARSRASHYRRQA